MNRWIIFLDQWERALDTGMEVIVTGDMNLNHLDWTSPPATQSSQTTKLRPLIDKLFQSIFSHSVSQCITVPTRFMNGQSPSGLDHFYTNRPEKLSVWTISLLEPLISSLYLLLGTPKLERKLSDIYTKGALRILTRKPFWQSCQMYTDGTFISVMMLT